MWKTCVIIIKCFVIFVFEAFLVDWSGRNDSVSYIAKISMMSPIVISVPTKTLLVSKTKGSFVRWLANLNIKRNLTSTFVNKYLPYWIDTLGKHLQRIRCQWHYFSTFNFNDMIRVENSDWLTWQPDYIRHFLTLKETCAGPHDFYHINSGKLPPKFTTY